MMLCLTRNSGLCSCRFSTVLTLRRADPRQKRGFYVSDQPTFENQEKCIPRHCMRMLLPWLQLVRTPAILRFQEEAKYRTRLNFSKFTKFWKIDWQCLEQMIQKHPDMYCFDDEFIFIIGHFMKKRLRISFYFAYFYFLEWIAFLLLKFYFFSLYVWPWLCRKWRESNLFGRWIFKFIIVHSFRFM